MKQTDNTTPHSSADYDTNVRQTIPYYELFHYETIDLIVNHNTIPEKWLDTGCGTGFLVEKALICFKNTQFVLSDPSKNMMDECKKRLKEKSKEKVIYLETLGTEAIKKEKVGTFDVVTSIQAHHYLNKEERVTATKNCFDLLNPNGIYVTFENICPDSQYGTESAMKRWMGFQLQNGRSKEDILEHAGRFNQNYFPITIHEHLKLLKDTGFRICEIFRYSYMQAGFYAIK